MKFHPTEIDKSRLLSFRDCIMIASFQGKSSSSETYPTIGVRRIYIGDIRCAKNSSAEHYCTPWPLIGDFEGVSQDIRAFSTECRSLKLIFRFLFLFCISTLSFVPTVRCSQSPRRLVTKNNVCPTFCTPQKCRVGESFLPLLALFIRWIKSQMPRVATKMLQLAYGEFPLSHELIAVWENG